MSLLANVQRPAVHFDVNNPEHRFWVGKFTISLKWGDCPYKFIFDGYGNTVAQMQRQLIEFYMKREFAQNIWFPVTKTLPYLYEIW